MNNYARFDIRLTHGKGSWVWDDHGKSYLDFISGIAVNTLGHGHPKLLSAINEQTEKMIHCSNLFHIPLQERLAYTLAKESALDELFFCNSGAEANEAAIKLVRKYWFDHGESRPQIITALQSFHGRTMMTLTATGQEKVKKGFQPLPVGFDYVPYNDIEALREMVNHHTAAIILEPIQGEGGVVVADANYLQQVRALCDAYGVLLVLDEVQTGVGRTGKMFAHQHYGVLPDIMTLAKGLGGGVPIGAMVAKRDISASFDAGSHGSTFGGNPLACAAALAVLQIIEEEKLLENVVERGAQLRHGLQALQANHSVIDCVRGEGLILGVSCHDEVAAIIKRCQQHGLLILAAGPKVLRLLPPLNVSEAEIEHALQILDQVLEASQ
ncbi:MAG: acetylornithine transaminase [Zetaproteobacteria bacterium]|nr:acetylornithine transaminase [Zetaproteobacteria bacterium]